MVAFSKTAALTLASGILCLSNVAAKACSGVNEASLNLIAQYEIPDPSGQFDPAKMPDAAGANNANGYPYAPGAQYDPNVLGNQGYPYNQYNPSIPYNPNVPYDPSRLNYPTSNFGSQYLPGAPYGSLGDLEQVKNQLRGKLTHITECLDDRVKSKVRLNENQWGALVSWAYNVGCKNIKSTRLIDRLNDDKEDPLNVISQELPKWNMVGGRVYPSLTRRRYEELTLFRQPSTREAHPDCR